MRHLALALLFTTTLAAQTVGNVEQTYGPFTPPPDVSMTVGATAHGLLLVWSEIDPGAEYARIHTGLLDFDGKLKGEIRTLPAIGETGHATAPQITTNTEQFFLVWEELDRTWGLRLDVDGVPLEAPRDLGKSLDQHVGLAWDGLFYRIHGTPSWKIRPDGTATTVRGSVDRRIPFATPWANGWVDWEGSSVLGRRCGIGGCTTSEWYSIRWSVITQSWVRYGSLYQTGSSSFAPAVRADEDDLLIVWSTKRGLTALPVIDGRDRPLFSLRSSLAEKSEPAIAGPLVVFASGGNVYGTIVDSNSFGAPFPISAGGEWDTQPRVYAIGNDRYLVTYIREHAPSSVSLVGRFVTVPD